MDVLTLSLFLRPIFTVFFPETGETGDINSRRLGLLTRIILFETIAEQRYKFRGHTQLMENIERPFSLLEIF